MNALRAISRFVVIATLVGLAALFFTTDAYGTGGGVTSVAAPSSVATLPDLQLSKEGTVKAVATQADGKIIVAGDFTTVNGVERRGLARLNADGTLDTTWLTDLRIKTDSTAIYALLIDGPYLYVGGNFFQIAGVDRFAVARLLLNEGGRVDPSWDVPLTERFEGAEIPGTVQSLVAAKGFLYIGGDFSRAGGAPLRHLVRVSMLSGRLDRRWIHQVSRLHSYESPVSCLRADSGWLYVGGAFRSIDRQSRPGLARISLETGIIDRRWNLKVVSRGFDLVADNFILNGDTIFSNGPHAMREGKDLPVIKKLRTQPDGTVAFAPEWAPNSQDLPSNPAALALSGSALFATGGSRIVKLDATTGAPIAGWSPSFANDARIVALEPGVGVLLVGGSFETVNGVVHLSLVRLRPENGRPDPAFTTQVGSAGSVFSLAEQADGKILVGGDFSYSGTVPRRHLLRLHVDGSLDLSWNPNVDGDVKHIAVSGDSLFIAGGFGQVGDLPRNKLAKLDSTQGDEADPLWTADVGSASATSGEPDIKGLAVNATHLYVATGPFTVKAKGLTRYGLFRVGVGGAGEVDADWNPQRLTKTGGTAALPNFDAGPLALTPDSLYVGDPFSSARKATGIVKVSLEGSGAIDPSWKVILTPPQFARFKVSSIYALAIKDRWLFAGGAFHSANGIPRKGLFKVSTLGSGDIDRAWNPNVDVRKAGDQVVTALGVAGDQLFAAGDFIPIDGKDTTLLAVFDTEASGALKASFPSVSAFSAPALLPRGNDVFVGGYGYNVFASDTFSPTHTAILLAATVLAPVLTVDPNDPYTFYLVPNAMDGPEVTHFKIDAVNGGQLFQADGVTPVAAGSFLSRAVAEAGLKFVPSAGSEGSQSVTARASLNDTGNSLSDGATMLALNASTTGPVFELSSGRYTVREQDGSVTLTVLNRNGRAGRVAYSLTDQTARAGIDFDAAAANGILDFAAGETSRVIVVPVTDDGIANGDRTFRVTLSIPAAASPAVGLRTRGALAAAPAAPLGIVGLRNGAEVVIFDNDFAGGRSGSLLEIAAPTPLPQATGTISLLLNPATPGQWRLAGDFLWRESGDVMTGLTRGNYDIELRPALGFRDPQPFPIALQNGTQYADTVDYAAVAPTGRGDLTLILRPNYLAAATDPAARAQWRREGETAWHDSGEMVSGLDEGVYTIEFKSVNGFREPTPLLAVVGADQENTVQASYRIGESRPGDPPVALTLAQTTARPFEFGGQVQTGRGFGSGFVADTRTVLTAAHVVFDDEALGYVPLVRWLFQKTRGEFEPEPLTPRGWYVFGGYAQQRIADRGVGGYEADEASPESRHTDAAALYFFTDTDAPGRGGYGGFLLSNADANEWLTTARTKRLSGYPMEGVPENERGRMHATPALADALTRETGRVFKTKAFHGLPGMSGGPLLVVADDGQFYPAGIFLHSGGDTFIRAIDSDVLGLLNRAQASASGGGNSMSGGATVVSPGLTATRFAPCQLVVQLRTAAGAVVTGGGWTVEGLSGFQASDVPVTINEPKKYRVTFKPVAGFDTPAPLDVTLTDHQLTMRPAIYYVGYEFALSSSDGTAGTVGPNERIQGKTATATARKDATGKVVARPTANFAFDYWEESGIGEVSRAASYTFAATRDRTLIAHFVKGIFFPYIGEYSGLLGIVTAGDPNTGADGQFTIKLDGKGNFTAVILLQGKRHALRGKFEGNGPGYGVLKTRPPLEVEFQLDRESGAQRVTAILRNGDVKFAEGDAKKAIFDGKSSQTSSQLAGNYTFAIPHPASPELPQGDGFGTMRIDAKGLVRIAGKLGDGTTFATAGRLGGDAQFAVFVPLYKSKGALGGLVTFDPGPAESDFAAPLVWTRPQLVGGNASFETQLKLAGSRYAPPAFKFSAATFTVSDGGLGVLPPKSITLDPIKNVGIGTSGDHFSLRVAPATGLLSGSFADLNGKPVAYAGALLQKSRSGHGSFIGPTGQRGSVELLAVP